jgi:hypothetical protein
MEVYETLIGYDMELNTLYHSPIRDDDAHPSFALFIPTRIKNARPDEVWFKDMATGTCGNVFTFTKIVALSLYGTELVTMYDVVEFIDSQLEIGIFEEAEVKRVAKVRNYVKILKTINYSKRAYTYEDLKYWKVLEQTKEDLEYWNVNSVHNLLNINNVVIKTFHRRHLVFGYNFYDKCKIYQPHGTRRNKFRNNCPGDDYKYYQGYAQMDVKAKYLIITKSYKDVMVLHKFFNVFMGMSVAVIAPHAESINLHPGFITWALGNFESVTVVPDYDPAGLIFAEKSKLMGLNVIFVSKKEVEIDGKMKVLEKDSADYLTIHGKDKTIKLLSTWKL